jgi:drug/metabolite transporter (DMT)-like permease
MNFLLAAVCVFLFSMTAPATRVAAQVLSPEIIAALRVLGAAAVAAIAVLVLDRWFPPRKAWIPLIATSIGSVVGFSLLIALAMKRVPSTHGAIALGGLPAVTAIYASIRDRKNPGLAFWFFCLLGSALACSFFFLQAGGVKLDLGDWILGASVISSAFGYVEGGRLSREFGGRRVMSWAILLALPFAIALAYVGFASNAVTAVSAIPTWREHPEAWLAVGYLALVSQSLGMFVWYGVLARGPMAKVALVQLLQPFMTLLFSIFLLKEASHPLIWITAFAVAGCVFFANSFKSARA